MPLSASNATLDTAKIAQQNQVGGSGLSRDTSIRVETISVGLLVEIPASKLLFRHHLTVPAESTVSQALETVYEVRHGVVCCDSRDIFAVNGLAIDPYKEKWWIIKVNKNTQNSSSTRKLSDGDIVELVYMENALHPVAHVHLEDWVNKQ